MRTLCSAIEILSLGAVCRCTFALIAALVGRVGPCWIGPDHVLIRGFIIGPPQWVYNQRGGEKCTGLEVCVSRCSAAVNSDAKPGY